MRDAKAPKAINANALAAESFTPTGWRLKMEDLEVLVAAYRAADEEVQQPGDNEHRYRALKRIRALIERHLRETERLSLIAETE